MTRRENTEEMQRYSKRPARPPINTSNYKRNNLPDIEKEFHYSMNFDRYSTKSCHDQTIHKQRAVNITDSFINSCRHERTELTVTLSDNTEEAGIIIAFDHSCIIMNNNITMQFLIMRNCIVKIVPMSDVDFIFRDSYNTTFKNDKEFINYSGNV
ncbi:MAG: RNA chaperone Hfq [Saccharofermentanales bacterium]